MKHSDALYLVKDEIDKAFKKSKTNNTLSYMSLLTNVKKRLLPIKSFEDASVIGFIFFTALMNPEYDEVEVNGELHIQKK